uniref:Uncharacterized protein n=1 Tax=Anopheles coluzzii TaxID=1518534 RepID=A0A8W7PET4_ANOCL
MWTGLSIGMVMVACVYLPPKTEKKLSVSFRSSRLISPSSLRRWKMDEEKAHQSCDGYWPVRFSARAQRARIGGGNRAQPNFPQSFSLWTETRRSATGSTGSVRAGDINSTVIIVPFIARLDCSNHSRSHRPGQAKESRSKFFLYFEFIFSFALLH